VPKRLLSVSYDPQLQRSRELILRQAGYDVVSATSLAEVTAACEHSHFDFALIGHSIPRQQQEEIAAKVREHSESVLIVGLQLLTTDRLPFADVTVPSHDPAALVEQLRGLSRLVGNRRRDAS
jgi:DNA-binding response OmpR family regulator